MYICEVMKKFHSLAFVLLATVILMGACTVRESEIPFHRTTQPTMRHSGEIRQSAFFMGSDRHDKGEGTNLKALLEVAVKGSEVIPSVVILNGDLVGGGAGASSAPEFSVNSIYQEIDSVLSLNSCEVILGYGAHDTNCAEGYDVFLSGPRRCDGYYVYGISFAQMKFPTDSAAQAAIELGRAQTESEPVWSPKEGEGAGPPSGFSRNRGYSGLDTLDVRGVSAQSASRHFCEWAASLTDSDPIVVMSHMPLHAHRKDNLGASVWVEALNEVGKDRDLLVIFAHNHTVERSRRDENGNQNATIEYSNYLLVPGDNMTVQSPVDSVSVGAEINFTYVNDGYITDGYSSVVTFTSTRSDGLYDTMNIRRFTINADDKFMGGFGSTRWHDAYEAPLRPVGSRIKH